MKNLNIIILIVGLLYNSTSFGSIIVLNSHSEKEKTLKEIIEEVKLKASNNMIQRIDNCRSKTGYSGSPVKALADENSSELKSYEAKEFKKCMKD